MTRRFALLIATSAVFAAVSCSKEEAPAPGAPAGSASTPAATVAKIPILPGYKYYAGGPVMKRDSYGRYRLASFAGEVQQPPSRGMIFGAKLDGDQLEYKVWGNGILLGVHKGIMRDGVYWEQYAESYREGKLVAREKSVQDDEAKRVNLTTEDIDPENGEVIRTKQASMAYAPIEIPDDDEEDEDEDDDAGTAPAKPEAAKKAAAPAAGEAPPAAPAPKAAPAAPPVPPAGTKNDAR